MRALRLVAWLATGVLAGSLLFWIISFGLARASGGAGEKTRMELQRMQQQRVRLEESRGQLDAWRSVPDGLKAFRARAIPGFDQFPAFRSDLQRRISESGLKSLRLTYRMRPVERNMQRVTLEFSLSGPYAAIKRFMHGVENRPGMVYLQSARLRRVESEVVAVFVMEAYFAR